MSGEVVVDHAFDAKFNINELISVDILKYIFQEFRLYLPQIFEDNLIFGFIFGGCAKGYALQSRDIDMLVCTRKADPGQNARFRRWYFDLHERTGLQPDFSDPGEVMDIASLHERLKFVAATPLRTNIPSYYEYEAIVWADAICGPKAAMVGDLGSLAETASICDWLPQRWRHDFHGFGTVPAAEVAVRFSPTLLCRRHLSFQQLGGRERPLGGEHFDVVP